MFQWYFFLRYWRDLLLEKFDEEMFNALVEKMELLTPAHFIFELKSGFGWRIDIVIKKGNLEVRVE